MFLCCSLAHSNRDFVVLVVQKRIQTKRFLSVLSMLIDVSWSYLTFLPKSNQSSAHAACLLCSVCNGIRRLWRWQVQKSEEAFIVLHIIIHRHFHCDSSNSSCKWKRHDRKEQFFGEMHFAILYSLNAVPGITTAPWIYVTEPMLSVVGNRNERREK